MARARSLQRQMSAARQALNRSWLDDYKHGQYLVVVDTLACHRGPGAPLHYEVHLATDDRQDAPRLVLLTADHQLYQQATRLIGRPQVCTVTYHPTHRKDGSRCLLLDSLTTSHP